MQALLCQIPSRSAAGQLLGLPLVAASAFPPPPIPGALSPTSFFSYRRLDLPTPPFLKARFSPATLAFRSSASPLLEPKRGILVRASAGLPSSDAESEKAKLAQVRRCFPFLLMNKPIVIYQFRWSFWMHSKILTARSPPLFGENKETETETCKWFLFVDS